MKVWPTGNSPIASGTICFLISVLVGYALNINLGSDVTLLFGIICGSIGLYLTKKYIQFSSNKDPKEVVIDEFSGQLIASSAAGIYTLFNLVAFVLFRTFDIFKPGIISRVEKLDGATGIMMDDWLAGIFSVVILIIFLDILITIGL